jgi:toluene monooxygenase system ferredoxin subunit
MPYRLAARLDDLWSGEMIGVRVGQRRLLLVNLDGQIYAYEDRCAHLGVALSGGRLAGGVLTCPAHEWCYDARSGCGINPKTASLRRVDVRVEGDEVWVDVDDAGPP